MKSFHFFTTFLLSVYIFERAIGDEEKFVPIFLSSEWWKMSGIFTFAEQTRRGTYWSYRGKIPPMVSKSNQINISIVIPNWNGKKLLQKNLPHVLNSFLSSKYKSSVEVIVVDDGSHDGSAVFLNRNYSKYHFFHIILHNTNVGFARSCNDGVLSAKGKIIILLNSDVIPLKGFIDPLAKLFEGSKDVFAVGCDDGTNHSLGYYKHGLIYHKAAETRSEHACNSLWVHGGAAAFDTNKWKELGGFDLLFRPFYWEDIDLCYRALKRGWKVIWEPRSVVIHKHETTISHNFSKKYVYRAALKNQIIFFFKNIDNKKWLLEGFLWAFINSFRNKDFAYAYIKATLALPEIIRFRFNKRHAVSDQVILRSAS